MGYIEDYEENDLPEIVSKKELDEKFKALQSDLQYTLLKLKEFDSVVKNILVDVKDLQEDITSDIMTPSHYNLCKNQYTSLYRKFDNVRNNYDSCVEHSPNRLTG
jgi:hypothetical protein